MGDCYIIVELLCYRHLSLSAPFDVYYGGNATGSLDLLNKMTDSPAVQAPLDPQEAPILDRVLYLRDKLSLLKQDKSTYVKSHDVLRLYDEVIEQVHQLNVIREEHGTPLEQNRGLSSTSALQASQSQSSLGFDTVDNVLDDCFQLISLFFLTIGRNNEAPAV